MAKTPVKKTVSKATLAKKTAGEIRFEEEDKARREAAKRPLTAIQLIVAHKCEHLQFYAGMTKYESSLLAASTVLLQEMLNDRQAKSLGS